MLNIIRRDFLVNSKTYTNLLYFAIVLFIVSLKYFRIDSHLISILYFFMMLVVIGVVANVAKPYYTGNYFILTPTSRLAMITSILISISIPIAIYLISYIAFNITSIGNIDRDILGIICFLYVVATLRLFTKFITKSMPITLIFHIILAIAMFIVADITGTLTKIILNSTSKYYILDDTVLVFSPKIIFTVFIVLWFILSWINFYIYIAFSEKSMKIFFVKISLKNIALLSSFKLILLATIIFTIVTVALKYLHH